MNFRTRQPTLNSGETIFFRKYSVVVDRFLRWGPILEDDAVEVYRVSATGVDFRQSFRTLHKIPHASQELLRAALLETEILNFIHSCGGHPHISCLIDHTFHTFTSPRPGNGGATRYNVYYLFESEEIGTLLDTLKMYRKRNDGELPEHKLLDFLLPVCKALSFMHSFKPPLLHRNIRPSNIIFTSQDIVQLSGFLGVAWELPEGSIRQRHISVLIEDLACYSAPRYRAPEALYPTSHSGITTKFDAWSIGVVLYVAAFQQQPFRWRNPTSIVNAEYSYPLHNYPIVEMIIDTLLQADAKKRPSMPELCETLSSILGLDYIANIPTPKSHFIEADLFKMPRRSYICPRVNQMPLIRAPNAPLLRDGKSFLAPPIGAPPMHDPAFLNPPLTAASTDTIDSITPKMPRARFGRTAATAVTAPKHDPALLYPPLTATSTDTIGSITPNTPRARFDQTAPTAVTAPKKAIADRPQALSSSLSETPINQSLTHSGLRGGATETTRLLTLVFDHKEAVWLLPKTFAEVEKIARNWIQAPEGAKFDFRITSEYVSVLASRSVHKPYVSIVNEETYQIAIDRVHFVRIEIVSDASPPEKASYIHSSSFLEISHLFSGSQYDQKSDSNKEIPPNVRHNFNFGEPMSQPEGEEKHHGNNGPRNANDLFAGGEYDSDIGNTLALLDIQSAVPDSSSLSSGDPVNAPQPQQTPDKATGATEGGYQNSRPYEKPSKNAITGDAVFTSFQGSTSSTQDDSQVHEQPSLAQPESRNQPSRTPSPSVNDIGSSIVSISAEAVRVNGHFCDVFEGSHITVGKVALKRPRVGATGYDEAVIRRFEREAMTWHKLQHPHILKFLGTFKRGGHLYFVSPFVNNGTLPEYIVRHPDANRIKLLCEGADAIAYLHQNKIVHGDIKGSNILIDDNDHSLLCDFGLTKMVHSRTSTVLKGAGTSRWQSPELLDDDPKSISSDTYAFAMTIVEVVTGQIPFAHIKNDMTVMLRVMQLDERPPKEPLRSSTGISYLNTWEVAEACWSKTPADRISMLVAFERLRADPALSS